MSPVDGRLGRRGRPGRRSWKGETMTRPSWDLYFMRMALLAASRSTCVRRHAGAVVVKDRMVLSTGYNDTPRGLPNCGDGGWDLGEVVSPSRPARDSLLVLTSRADFLVHF